MIERAKATPRPDGTPVRVLTQAEVEVLLEVIERELFWNGARKRFAVMARYAGFGSIALVTLSLWWPWINEKVTFILAGIPN